MNVLLQSQLPRVPIRSAAELKDKNNETVWPHWQKLRMKKSRWRFQTINQLPSMVVVASLFGTHTASGVVESQK